MTPPLLACALTLLIASSSLCGCGSDAGSATVQLKNDFNNAAMAAKPPWTICRSSYLGVDFGKLPLDATSAAKTVAPGLDYVLMVGAFGDPDCNAASLLPLASKNEEETVNGQTRTVAINVANHQGPCPPEGVPPIPELTYERIRALWPDAGFRPYAERLQNPACVK